MRTTAVFLLLLSFFAISCGRKAESVRLERKEVLYDFSQTADGCTDLIGKGVIEKVGPEQVNKVLPSALSNLGYISVKDGIITVDLPWPYTDIEEKVTLTQDKNGVIIIGSRKVHTLKIALSSFNDGTLVTISGNMCLDMPGFLRENVLSSFIKKIVINLRDTLE